MAALFALCLLSPVAAFAFSNAPAHCLTLAEAAQAASAGHHHGDGDHTAHLAMAHEHADHATPAAAGADDLAVPAKCCGLFCVSVLTPPVLGGVETRLVATTEVALQTAAHLLGRTPNGIDRPPRFLLSL